MTNSRACLPVIQRSQSGCRGPRPRGEEGREMKGQNIEKCCGRHVSSARFPVRLSAAGNGVRPIFRPPEARRRKRTHPTADLPTPDPDTRTWHMTSDLQAAPETIPTPTLPTLISSTRAAASWTPSDCSPAGAAAAEAAPCAGPPCPETNSTPCRATSARRRGGAACRRRARTRAVAASARARHSPPRPRSAWSRGCSDGAG